MTASGTLQTLMPALSMSALGGECVAKLDEKQRPDNNRIGTNTFLNQYFALTPDPESMLLAWARKIVLQHIRGVKRTCLIRALMSANDPLGHAYLPA